MGDNLNRERLLDMAHHVQQARVLMFTIGTATLLLCVPWLGWWPLVAFAFAGFVIRLTDARLMGGLRPEYVMFGVWVVNLVAVSVVVGLSGGPRSPAITWFAILTVALGTRTSTRGVCVGAVLGIVALLTVSFAADPHAVVHDPPLVLLPITAIIAVARYSIALMQSDVIHRGAAVIDPLTGMLNRSALDSRTVELEHQAELTGAPIGLILGDIDHFKQINDSRGHATGDAVLRDLAYVLRKQLRAFDFAYRIGGEEFLVLLPGADMEHSAALAERLRTAVAAETVGGLHVTMSFGVSVSPVGGHFDREAVSAEADSALYEAKRTGRDRVCCASVAELRARALVPEYAGAGKA